MSSKEVNRIPFKERLRKRRKSQIKKPVSIPSLPDMLKELVKVEDAQWGMYAFKREPLKGRFSDAEKRRYVQLANECGVAYARKIKEEYPNLSVLELAIALGLEVHFPEKPLGGGHIIFAQFVEPNQVTVYKASLTKARKLVEELHLYKYFDEKDIAEILLAHEIFHYIEEQNEDKIFTRTEKVCLWKILKFHYQSKIVCLGEIAGMAFAKEMLALSFSPYVLDSFLVYSYNEEVSYYLYEEAKNIT